MTSVRRRVLVLGVLASVMFGGPARAAVTDTSGDNIQDGDNAASTHQHGQDTSGAANGGQVVGVVSAGRTSVDATNRSVNSDVTTGDARGTNAASSFTGVDVASASGTAVVADVFASCPSSGASACENVQDGSNRLTSTQSSSATTGDGVAGQVIGVVTAAGGATSVVADNLTQDSSARTGDAGAPNRSAAFVGLSAAFTGNTLVAADASTACPNDGAQTAACQNVQSGSNRLTTTQSSSATTGDGVAGQVIGAVSAGATSIDARNRSVSVDVTTGNAASDNNAASFAGLDGVFTGTATVVADTSASCPNSGAQTAVCQNVQDGSNRTTAAQSSSASTGSGVGGQVVGAVTTAGGSTSVVADNVSQDSSIGTGDARSANHAAAFVGLSAAFLGNVVVAADAAGACPNEGAQTASCQNVQNGSNRLSTAQTSSATTGDGVAGQVIGAVSAGATSIDAGNRSVSDDVTTGDADSTNHAASFVGLDAVFGGSATVVADAFASCPNSGAQAGACQNVQDGSNRAIRSQLSSATSGDAIAGQVTGVVTSAGGSSSVVVDNASSDIDAASGASTFDNHDETFVGLIVVSGGLTI